MIPSVYINLDDDVAKVAARIKKEKSASLVLVCPKRCQLFSDSINLRLLKKQADLLKKEVHILTMDERGQLYAKEAGFGLKFLPKSHRVSSFSDIQIQRKTQEPEEEAGESGLVKTVASFVSGLVSKKPEEERVPDIEASTVFEDPDLGKTARAKSRLPKAFAVSRTRPAVKVSSALPLKAKQKASVSRQGLFLALSLGLSLIVLLALVFFVLPSAQVVIFAKSEPITRDFDVNLDTALSDVNAARLALPAVKVEKTVELKSKFQSQGKKDVGNKAMGSVRIFNFTGQVLNLKAETTSLAAGSKVYYLAEDAMQIKPTKYKNAQTKEIDEASLSAPVEIIAGAGGEDSNLPAGIRMEITNQVFGSRPQLLYAKTETPISGGTSRFISFVSDADISSARDQLGQQALGQVRGELASQKLLLAENSYRVEVVDFSADKQPGVESPSFGATLKAKVSGLAFSEDQLKSLLIARIGQTVSGRQTLKTDNDFNLSYKIKAVDLNIFSGTLAVHFEGKLIARLDSSELPSKLLGKSREQASEVLQSMEEVEKSEITLSPSWQGNFPWFASKIKIELR